jgi:branched-chain amino acid aminotransferase
MAFFREHYACLQSRLRILFICLEDILASEELHRQAVNLINKNRYFGGNVLRITIILETGTGNPHCLMECRELEDPVYALNRKGFVLGLYDDLNIPVDRLTGKIDRSPLVDFFAGRYKTSRNLDDCILFNQQGHITSSLSSSIFFRIREKIHTPPARDGSPSSVEKEQVIHILREEGNTVEENTSLRAMDIQKADEIFLTNPCDGIRWVVAVNRFRYFNRTGARLIARLNDKAFGMVNSGRDFQGN